MQKVDLPYEYVNDAGAKFWYAPLNRCIQLGGDHGKECVASFPGKLRKGTVLTPEQHDSLIKYLTVSVNRLRELNVELKTAETVVDEL